MCEALLALVQGVLAISAPRPARAPRAPRPARPPRTLALGRPQVRLRGGLAVVLLLLAVVGGRLVQLQGVDATAYAAQAQSQKLRDVRLPAVRGDVVDRNGVLLAASVQARTVFADPRLFRDPDARTTTTEAADALAGLLGVEAAGLREKLERPNGYVVLARGVAPETAKEVAALRLPGVGSDPESRRVHPGGELAANVLGWVNREGEGLGGVESTYDEVLAGTPGRRLVETDGEGRRIPTGEFRETPPVDGRPVRLTLDRDLQWQAQRSLSDAITRTGSSAGTVIVMDPRTGEVLALASSPTFHADKPGEAPPEARKLSALTDVYEPGSVNKVITASAALELGIVTPDTVMTIPLGVRVADKTFTDSHPPARPTMTFTNVLATSSNVGTIMVAQQLGKERLYAYLKKFGFGEKTGVVFPGESRGILPAVEDWSGSQAGTIPIGQGVSVTALQAASVYATVANGGVRVTPRLVQGVLRPDGSLDPVDVPAPRRVLGADTARVVSRMLEEVTTDNGTAPAAAVAGYRVAGKTGTARRVDPATGRYKSGSYTASFVGYAPADAPRLVVQVVLDEPRTAIYGGAVAAPVFKDVMAYALRHLQVPPTGVPAPPVKLFP